mmetsp:Transcript_1200/g.2818  ORF Transcript_1200/g.2818 Transcript_1200/m.2818 type:complete len:421 (+) Transcript_1200:232-1494(+)
MSSPWTEILNFGEIAANPLTGKRDEPVAKCSNLARSSVDMSLTMSQNHDINSPQSEEFTWVLRRHSSGSREGYPEMSSASSRWVIPEQVNKSFGKISQKPSKSTLICSRMSPQRWCSQRSFKYSCLFSSVTCFSSPPGHSSFGALSSVAADMKVRGSPRASSRSPTPPGLSTGLTRNWTKSGSSLCKSTGLIGSSSKNLQVTLPKGIGSGMPNHTAKPMSRPTAYRSEKRSSYGRGASVLSGSTIRCPSPRSASAIRLRPKLSNQSRVTPPASTAASSLKLIFKPLAIKSMLLAGPMQAKVCWSARSRSNVMIRCPGIDCDASSQALTRACLRYSLFMLHSHGVTLLSGAEMDDSMPLPLGLLPAYLLKVLVSVLLALFRNSSTLGAKVPFFDVLIRSLASSSKLGGLVPSRTTMRPCDR